jgi:hypothetical protein
MNWKPYPQEIPPFGEPIVVCSTKENTVWQTHYLPQDDHLYHTIIRIPPTPPRFEPPTAQNHDQTPRGTGNVTHWLRLAPFPELECCARCLGPLPCDKPGCADLYPEPEAAP